MIFALFLFFSLFSPKTFCISYCMYNFCFQILYNGILFHLIIQQIFMQNLLCQTLNCLLGTDLILIAFTEHAFIFYIYSKYAMYNYSKTHFHWVSSVASNLLVCHLKSAQLFLSQSDLFHLIRPSLGLPTLLQMALFHSFLWPISHCIYVPRDHISMDGIAGTLMGRGLGWGAGRISLPSCSVTSCPSRPPR